MTKSAGAHEVDHEVAHADALEVDAVPAHVVQTSEKIAAIEKITAAHRAAVPDQLNDRRSAMHGQK